MPPTSSVLMCLVGLCFGRRLESKGDYRFMDGLRLAQHGKLGVASRTRALSGFLLAMASRPVGCSRSLALKGLVPRTHPCSMTGDDDEENAVSLEQELKMRIAALENAKKRERQGSTSDPPFTGIREIVLDDEGKPQSIPRRPAPPPGWRMEEQVSDLIRLDNPSFFLGFAISIVSFILFLMILNADASVNNYPINQEIIVAL